MFPLIETAIAFAAAMLAASLVVSGCVQVVLSLGRYRSRGVEEMLLSLMQGFRDFNNDPALIGAVGDTKARQGDRPLPPDPAGILRAERAFVDDVMTDPTLQARGSAVRYSEDPTELARMVEYIDAGDLVVVAVSHAKYEAGELSDDVMEPRYDLKLPRSWFGDSQAAPAYFNTKSFSEYVARFFATLEATAAQRFKGRIRQLTIFLAAILVVVFNFDSLQLMRTLYQNSGVRSAVAAQAEQIADIAARSGVKAPGTPAESPEAAPVVIEESPGQAPSPGVQLQQAAAALDQEGLGIGWQGSYIVSRFCAYRGSCSTVTPSITLGQLALDVSLWAFGLIASCVMLSFGAPFWYGALKQLLNLGNELKGKRASTDSGGIAPTSTGTPQSAPFSMRPRSTPPEVTR